MSDNTNQTGASGHNGELSKIRSRKRSLILVFSVALPLLLGVCWALLSVFGYDDFTKNHQAKLRAKAIEKAAKAYYLKYNAWPPNIQSLINLGKSETPFLEGGKDAITTPWGGKYEVESVIVVHWVDGDGNAHTQWERP